MAVDCEIMTKFNHHAQWEQSLAELHANFDTNLAHKKQVLTAWFKKELDDFRHNLWIETDKAKTDTNAKARASICRSLKAHLKPYHMELCTHKPKTTDPSDNYVPTFNSNAVMFESESDCHRQMVSLLCTYS